MSQFDEFCADPLLQWVTASTETQLRLMTYGLLISIQRTMKKLPKKEENSEALDALIYGLTFAAAVKDNYDNSSATDTWFSKNVAQATLQDIITLFSSDEAKQ